MTCLAEGVCVLVVAGTELIFFPGAVLDWDGSSADNSGCFGCCCAVLPSVKDCLVSQMLPVRRRARRCRELARTAGQSWPKEHFPHGQYKLGQLAGRDWSLKGDRLDVSQQWGAAVLSITGFSGVSFFNFIITISRSIFYFVSVINLLLAQTMQFLLFPRFSFPSQQGRGSEWLCGA